MHRLNVGCAKSPNMPKGLKQTPIEWTRDGSCIVVTSHKPMRKGYIQINRKGERFLLHRRVCERRYGPIGDLDATHSCDNRLCINPDHLRPGTRKQNLDEMKERGRALLGIKNPKVKLTEKQVREIRKAAGSQLQIGLRFGICQNRVSQIKRRIAWAHLSD